jgi:hypothetical protein
MDDRDLYVADLAERRADYAPDHRAGAPTGPEAEHPPAGDAAIFYRALHDALERIRQNPPPPTV